MNNRLKAFLALVILGLMLLSVLANAAVMNKDFDKKDAKVKIESSLKERIDKGDDVRIWVKTGSDDIKLKR